MNSNNLFISWIAFSRRGQLISEKFKLKHYQIQSLKHKYYLAPIRYILQTIRTLKILFIESPKIIFVQNPPIFACIVVYLFSKFRDAKFIIDSHTGALLAPWWRWSLPLHSYLSRRALVTIVTNPYLAGMVNNWGAKAFILPDIPFNFPDGRTVKLETKFNIAVINTFSPDEPINEILEAASSLNEIQFYITGDTIQAKKQYLMNPPKNVKFTNFLTDDDYIGLLRAVQVIMVLTKDNHTMQRGACEALSIGKPIITSDWPILREFFNKGTVYVDNTCAGIKEGILKVQKNLYRLKSEISVLKKERLLDWKEKSTEIRELFEKNDINQV
jgi:glycosyltransferase involved in cell wall biosynthesis